MPRLNAVRLVTAAVAGYLLGSIPAADAASRLASGGDVDLRTRGTGNPGSANAIAVLGKGWGAFVFVLDFMKGVLAGLVGRAIAGDGGAYAAATASVAGHNWPVWSRFRGGKGVATAAGSCLAVFPGGFPVVAAAMGTGAAATRRADATIQITAPVFTGSALVWWRSTLPNRWGPRPSPGLALYAFAVAAMVLGKFRTAR